MKCVGKVGGYKGVGVGVLEINVQIVDCAPSSYMYTNLTQGF